LALKFKHSNSCRPTQRNLSCSTRTEGQTDRHDEANCCSSNFF